MDDRRQQAGDHEKYCEPTEHVSVDSVDARLRSTLRQRRAIGEAGRGRGLPVERATLVPVRQRGAKTHVGLSVGRGATLNRQFEQWHECGDRAMSSPSVRHGFDHDVAVNDASGEPEPVDELLAAAYALDGPEANRSLYARWASTYETDFIAESGYRYHERVAAVFVEHCLPAVSADEAVADVGCGTGVVGQALVRHQRVIVDGLDISPEMLQQATRKVHDGEPVYRQLLEADLTQPLTIEPGSYAGLISVGTFTHGHLGPEVLDGLLAIVRSGGRCAIGINAAHFASHGFGAAFDRLIGTGRISDLRLVDVAIYADDDRTDPDQYAHVAVFTVA
jgi:SAM-dependent methyltransferase